MLRNTIRRGGITLALLLALGLGLIGATPAAAQGFRSDSAWEAAWHWLAGLFGLTVDQNQPASGNEGGLSRIWDMEGPGFDPNGAPVPSSHSSGTEEGPGFDPNGSS
ncbi:MAG: hypothetical protein ABUT39_13375 [Acidobacteriota bacterium]